MPAARPSGRVWSADPVARDADGFPVTRSAAGVLRGAAGTRSLAVLDERIGPFNQAQQAILQSAMAGLKARAKTLVELADNARFYVALRPIPMDDKAKAQGTPEARALLALPESTAKSVAGRFGVSVATLYREIPKARSPQLPP